MGNDAHTPSTPPVSRRAMIGGLAAGAGALGLGLAAKPVAAAVEPGQAGAAPSGASFGPDRLVATPKQAGLNYVLYSGFQIEPITSVQKWERFEGAFRFTGTAPGDQGYCQPSIELPLGSVVREIEVYGVSGTGSVATLELWQTSVQTIASADQVLADIAIPAGAGHFTVTVAVELEWNDQTQTIPFINILDTVARATAIKGIRIGYEAVAQVPAFVPISPIPRPYNTRDTAGLTKLNPGEERTITLPVPAGISAAVVQLTVTETGAGGFVGVFPADAASWPGNSSINWSAVNENVGGTVVTAVSADGKIKIRGGGSPTHVIIDVPGYLT